MNSAKNNIGLDSLKVSSAMTVNVISGTESQSARDICKTMYKYKFGSIIITKDASDTPAENTPVGIVTERDYVRLIGFSDLFVVDAPISESYEQSYHYNKSK